MNQRGHHQENGGAGFLAVFVIIAFMVYALWQYSTNPQLRGAVREAQRQYEVQP
jgi:predicted negative regulator of RcsB-dependent stress response